jgi:hypothetical protein
MLVATVPCNLLTSCAHCADDTLITVTLDDSHAVLENPGMGWVFHHYDNSMDGYGRPLGPSYDGSEFPGLTVCYLRIAWSHLEPSEGKYNFALLDEPIDRYGAAGKKFAFRFTVFEGSPNQGTPAWVRKAGAKGSIVTTYGVESWEPDYDDPIFCAKLSNFLSAAGERYNGNPNLAFVDVGTLGIWGEGHPIARRYGIDTLRRHIEMHQKAFKASLIAGIDDWNTWFNEENKPTAMEMARSMGLAFRDDSLCVYADPTRPYSSHLAQPFVHDTPVILEMGHYAYAKKVNAWDNGKRYFQAVRDYRGSYVSVHANPISFLKENKDIIYQINQILGYRLNLEEAAWPATANRTDGLTITSYWRNVGVAPCLPGGYVTWSLANSKGTLAATLVHATGNVRSLDADPEKKTKPTSLQEHFPFPSNIKPGTYTVMVSVGDSRGTPQIALPLIGQVDKERRYPIGTITLN